LFVVLVVWSVGAWFMLGPTSTSHKLRYDTPNDPDSGLPVPASGLHWQKLADRYPATFHASIPIDKPAVSIPRIQIARPREDAIARKLRLERQAAVRASFQHSWSGYKDHAWLHDEVTPITRKAKNPFGGWAATLGM